MEFFKHKISVLFFLEELLLAIILNMNAVKVVLKTTGNSLTYVFFLMFVAVSIGQRFIIKDAKFPIDYELLFILFVFFVFAGLSTLWSEIVAIGEKVLKFSLGIIIAYLAALMSEDSRLKAFQISLFISTFYGAYILFNYTGVYSAFIRSGIYNYLVITLPLGLGLSFALVIIMITDTGLWMKLCLVLSIVIQTLALIKFAARGNLIFPIILTAGMLIYKNRRNPKLLLVSIILVAGLIWMLYFVTIKYGDELLVYRLTRLFEGGKQEKRLPLYRYYITYIFEHANYVIGQGFGAASKVLADGGFHESYPHNFILELVGENGLVGIALIIFIFVRLLQSEYRYLGGNISICDNEEVTNQVFAITNAGLFFYLLTYFKSYSIYDGYQLFIFVSMMLNMSNCNDDIDNITITYTRIT